MTDNVKKALKELVKTCLTALIAFITAYFTSCSF